MNVRGSEDSDSSGVEELCVSRSGIELELESSSSLVLELGEECSRKDLKLFLTRGARRRFVFPPVPIVK